MSDTAQQSEWRRGGDQQNPAITKTGDWEAKSKFGRRQYRIHSLDRGAEVLWRNDASERWQSSNYDNLGDLLLEPWEWRFIGPLPGEPEPREDGKRGDRDRFCLSVREWNETKTRSTIFFDDHIAFLCSPAGRSAVLSLWGEKDEQESGGEEYFQKCIREELDAAGIPSSFGLLPGIGKLRAALAEARKEIAKLEAERVHWKSNHDNQVALKRAVLDRPDLEERAKSVASLAAERDVLKAEVELLNGDKKAAHAELTNAGIGDKGYGLETRILQLRAERDALRSRLTAAEAKVEELTKERDDWERAANEFQKSGTAGCYREAHDLLTQYGATTEFKGNIRARITDLGGKYQKALARLSLTKPHPFPEEFDALDVANQRIKSLEKDIKTLHEELSDPRIIAALSSAPSESGDALPLDRDEAIRRLWAMAAGQRDQIEDLQERMREVEDTANVS